MADAVDRIAGLELRHASTDCIYNTGNIGAKAIVFWLAETRHEPNGVRLSSHEVPVVRIERSGANLERHFRVTGSRLLDFFASENVRGAVLIVDDRLHGCLGS